MSTVGDIIICQLRVMQNFPSASVNRAIVLEGKYLSEMHKYKKLNILQIPDKNNGCRICFTYIDKFWN